MPYTLTDRARRVSEFGRSVRNEANRFLTSRPGRPAKIILLFNSAVFVGLSLAAFFLLQGPFHAHVDSFHANSVRFVVDPCGLPTPDPRAMLLALGLQRADWSMLAGADYGGWVERMEDALCNSQAPSMGAQIAPPPSPPVDAPPPSASPNCGENAMVALARLTKRAEFDTEVAFTSWLCDLHSAPFGDVPVRIVRAYYAFMPAFVHYHTHCKHKKDVDPLLGRECTHLCSVRDALQAANGDEHLLIESQQVGSTTAVSEMLHRLLALSVVGYHDRRNRGACFSNLEIMKTNDHLVTSEGSSQAVCEKIYGDGGAVFDTSQSPIDRYRTVQEAVHTTHGCGTPKAPLAPIVATDYEAVSNTTTIHKRDTRVGTCVALLQYGAFDTTRLFGASDPVGEFVVNARDSGNFIRRVESAVVESLFLDPVRDHGAKFADATKRLQLYAAYKVAATAIWGTAAMAVVGFFAARAIVPGTLVLVNIARNTNAGLPDRPPPDVFVLVALGVALLTSVWVVFLEASVQIVHPSQPTCTHDWYGSKEQVYSAAFESSWGVHTFGGAPEAKVALCLVGIVAMAAFHEAIVRALLPKPRSPPPTRRNEVAVLVMTTLLSAASVGLFAAQSGETGKEWRDELLTGSLAQQKKKGREFTNDLTVALYSALFVGAALGTIRQRWCLQTPLPKAIWFFASIGLLWVPWMHASDLLETELGDAFDAERGTRYILSIINLVCVAMATALHALPGLKFVCAPAEVTARENVQGSDSAPSRASAGTYAPLPPLRLPPLNIRVLPSWRDPL